jgi:hypothetical protein
VATSASREPCLQDMAVIWFGRDFWIAAEPMEEISGAVPLGAMSPWCAPSWLLSRRP